MNRTNWRVIIGSSVSTLMAVVGGIAFIFDLSALGIALILLGVAGYAITILLWQQWL